jgi:ubiquinone/menaquinone biosynthesis C-methylase UbiE
MKSFHQSDSSKPEGHHLSDAPYMLPKDMQETNRLDLQHVLLASLLQGNFVAPIEQPTSILDIGCGTGRWCQEMATAFPQASVTGIDLVIPDAAEQGVAHWPHNCTFVGGNILQGLPFDDEHFDFVHQRLLLGAIPAHRWPELIKELLRVTRSGGWLELIESDAIFPQSGPHTRQIGEWIAEAGKRRGIDLSIGKTLGRFLEEAGGKEVKTRMLDITMGNRDDPIENMSATVVEALFQSLKPLILSQLKVSEEEFDALIPFLPAEWEKYRTANPFYIISGQRSQ